MSLVERDRRVVMVSGGTRGMGLSIADELARAGWLVSVGCRRPEEQAAQDDRSFFRFDALDPSSEREWVDGTVERFGRIDAVVHNAGIMIPVTVLEASDADFDALFGINVKSPMRLSRLAWPHLVASGAGRIVTIASLSGKRVRADRSGVYAMSKFAAVALAHALRRAGSEVGIRSTAICPGYVATDMATGLSSAAPETMTQPGDLARIVRTVIELPTTASIAEIPVNWTVEDAY